MSDVQPSTPSTVAHRLETEVVLAELAQTAADTLRAQAARIAELEAEVARLRPMIGLHDPTGADHMEDAARLAAVVDDVRVALVRLDADYEARVHAYHAQDRALNAIRAALAAAEHQQEAGQ